MTNTQNSVFHQLFDTFEVIGSGKFATVRRCISKETGNEFAAKFIRKRSSSGRMGQTLEDINTEVDILKQIDDKHIVKLYHVFDTRNEVILVLELVKGGELFDLISNKGYLSEEQAIDYIKQILIAVKHLHDRNIVHLDLKPENILLSDSISKQIKLIDFGISRLLFNKQDVKGLYGTPEFAAPEIINYEPVSTGTDMWAIGCIVFNLLSGASPFLGNTKQDTFVNITAADYHFDDQYFGNVSNLAKTFINGLLIKHPKKRYTVDDCLNHDWIKQYNTQQLINCQITSHTYNQMMVCRLSNPNTRLRWKKAIDSVIICYQLFKTSAIKSKLTHNAFIANQSNQSKLHYFENDENFISAALFGAVEDGNINAIQELFAMSNIDPNQCNRHGESLVHFCAGLGYLDILKFLHQKQADITLTDDRGDCIVHWAARQNQWLVIRYFYDSVANVNQTNKNLETPLHVAARYGHVEAIEQLCKCGANVNAADEHGETAMLISVWHGFPKIVHILGEVGARTDIKNKEGETALHVAAARGHVECVRCLLEAGARTDQRNKTNYTPLHLSLKRQHVSVATLLLRAGADIEAVDDRGERPIHYASRFNLLQICSTLCSMGCNVNAPNKQGLYPLHLAAKNGHIEIVRCLCLAGSSIDQKNRDAIIPQICAIAQNHTEIADLLTRLKSEPTKDEYISQLVSNSQPIQRFKLKILGNSGTGKTTLIESLKCGYLSSWFRRSSKSLNHSQHKKVDPMPPNSCADVSDSTITSLPTCGQSEVHPNVRQMSGQKCTLGVDCQQLNISGVGDMSVWEFSANERYFQVYDHFIGNVHCLHAIVFRLCDSIDVQMDSIMFWLYLLQSRTPVLEPLTYCGKSSRPSKIVLIGTHADLINSSNLDIQSNVSTVMTKICNTFGLVFDIHDHMFVMDATAAGSASMKQLKHYLNAIKGPVLQGMPSSTGFLEAVMTFINVCRKASPTFPVLSLSQFKEIIRSQINPLASDEHFNQIILQLQTMGEVLYLKCKSDISQDMIVLSPRWLTVDVMGYLLSEDYMCKRTVITGTYSVDDIQLEFPETDALDLLQVLEAINICVQCDNEGDIAYEFPCLTYREPLIADNGHCWRPNDDLLVYCGLGITCPEHVPNGRLLSCIFSRLQIALRVAVKAHPDYELYDLFNWFQTTQLSVGPIESLITCDTTRDAIEVRVRGPEDQPIECFLFMQDIINIMDTSIGQMCCGLLFDRYYLSPKHLSQQIHNESRYSSASVLKVMLSSDCESPVDQCVQSDDQSVSEHIADIICFGIRDLNAIRKTTKFRSIPSFSSLMSSPASATDSPFKWSDSAPTLAATLHSSNLSLLTKQRLCAVLDPPEAMGRDWCMFGILLGMTDKLPKLDPGHPGHPGHSGHTNEAQHGVIGHNVQQSPTARLIDECVREPNTTLQVLVNQLTELARNDAIDVILQTAPLFRFFPSNSQPDDQCLPYNDEMGNVSSGVSSASQASTSNLSR